MTALALLRVQTLAPGLHFDVPDDIYHADQLCAVPTLSRSIAHKLLTRSPLHAWYAHPRLNPRFKPSPPTDAFDIGTAVHSRVLLGRDIVEVIDADDWRTKDARAARDAAREAGRIPVLPPQAQMIEDMVAEFEAYLALDAGRLFRANASPEVTAIYEDAGVMCRARFDLLPDEPSAPVIDYKTTRNAAPDAFMRAVWAYGYDLQAAWYSRALKVLRGRAPEAFIFIAQEKEPPYAVTAHQLSPAAYEWAEGRCDDALSIWRNCLAANTWPGYPDHVHEVPPPPWSLDREAQMTFTDEGE